MCVHLGRGGGLERVTYGFGGAYAWAHGGDLRDSQPLQLSYMEDAMQPYMGHAL